MTIVDHSALGRALRRWWFTNPAYDGVPLSALPPFTRNAIVAEALQIQEETCTAQD